MELDPEVKKILVCDALKYAWHRVREDKGNLRRLLDFKAIVDEDYGDLYSELDTLEKKIDSLKLKYRCGEV
ncbi:MAG: hypothetical protein QXM02_06800 [Thermoproteota archaeon]